jgi:hypothetical protein
VVVTRVSAAVNRGNACNVEQNTQRVIGAAGVVVQRRSGLGRLS